MRERVDRGMIQGIVQGSVFKVQGSRFKDMAWFLTLNLEL